jgi:hypothetical protein
MEGRIEPSSGSRPPLFVVLLRNIGCVTLVVVVLTGLLAALFVDCGSLLDAGIVRLELESGVGREIEDLLHDFADVTNGKLVSWIHQGFG